MQNIVWASLSKLIQDIMSLMSDVNNFFKSIILLHAYPIYYSQGALKVLLVAGLHNCLTIAKFQNAQVAKSSPEIAISPARAANVVTYAWD